MQDQLTALDRAESEANEHLQLEQRELQEAQATFERLDGELRYSKGLEKDLENHLRQAESDAKAARTSLGKADSMVLQSIKETDEVDSEIAKLESVASEISKEITKLTYEIEEAQTDRSAADSLLREANQALESADSELRKLQGEKASVANLLVRRRDVIASIVDEIEKSCYKNQEAELELKGLTKELELVVDDIHAIASEVIQRRELLLPKLLEKVQSRNDRICEVERLRKDVSVEADDIRREIKRIGIEIERERKAKKQIDNERDILMKQVESKREESLSLISDKDAANVELGDLIRQYRKHAAYLRDRESERDNLTKSLESIRSERLEAQRCIDDHKSQLEAVSEKMKEKEEAETSQRTVVLKLEKQVESLSRKLDDQRRMFDMKAERIREAQLCDKSSEASLSLLGKVQQAEKELALNLSNCKLLQAKRGKAEKVCGELASRLATDSEQLEFLRNVVIVREHQKRRMNVEIQKYRFNLKQIEKEITKRKYDLDKLGSLVHHFALRIEDSASEDRLTAILKKSNAHKLVELNDQLRKEVDEFVGSLPGLEKERLELEKQIEVEAKVQKCLFESGLDRFNVEEVQKAINQMKVHVSSLRKRKEALKASILRRIDKNEFVGVPASASLCHLSSCSTANTSLGSLPSAPEAVDVESLRMELAVIRAQISSVRKDVGTRTKLLQWTEYNSKLLPYTLLACRYTVCNTRKSRLRNYLHGFLLG